MCGANKFAIGPGYNREGLVLALFAQLKGAFNCIKAILPDMIAVKSGAIVLLGSIASDNVPPINQSDYVVAKASVSSFAKNLAAELGPKGIRVNPISPGPIKTRAASGIGRFDELIEKASERAPSHVLATIEDVGMATAFLASDYAKLITGDTVYVDGGYHVLG